MKRVQKFKLVSAFFCLAVCLLFGRAAYAVEADAEGIRIQISPNIERIELDPGAHYKDSVTITNNGSKPLEYEMSVSPYSVDSITYAPIYTVENSYTMISKWISFDNEDEAAGTIDPGVSTIVNYSINVPNDVPSGGQYAVIFVEAKELDEENSIHATASPGLVIVARVSGNTRETGEIKNVKLPRFLLNPPVTANATFTNTGNVDADAKMTLKIENYFNGDVIYDGTKEPLEKTVFPGTSRDLSMSWANIPRLGVFKVTFNAEYLNDAMIKQQTVIICPIWFIAIILLVIAFIIVRTIMKKRENNRTRSNSQSDNKGSEHFNI